jgi:hypothetical protein
VASVSLNRNREFILLWSGQALSGLSSQMSQVAYPLLVLAVTGSPGNRHPPKLENAAPRPSAAPS